MKHSRPLSRLPRARMLLAAFLSALGLLLVALFPHGKNPDLLVYGATPQGVMAAVTAARQGERVLLIEPTSAVGGVLTQAWLATLDLSVDARGFSLAQGTFREFFYGLHHDNSFDVLQAQRVLDELLASAGVKVMLDTRVTGVQARAGRVISLALRSPGRATTIRADSYIDATDTADLAARSGALFTLGRADTGLDQAQMVATLVFRVTGLDWKILKALERRENRRQNPRSWSLTGLLSFTSGYHPSDPSRFFLRGFNAARQDDGSLLVNALLIYGVDGTSPASLMQASRDGAHEAARVVNSLRRQFPGVFGQARLGGVAPQLYIRESRHLLGEVRLTADDVLYGHHFHDAVGVNAYPLDGQDYLPGQRPFLLGTPRPYGVPFGALIPAGFSNLLVVSQAASFDSVAAFSARVVPLQMTLGEAAGQASVLAHWTRLGYRTIDRSILWTALLRLMLRSHHGLVTAPPAQRGQPCEDAGRPEEGEATALLRASLMSSPYYYIGCLHLKAPETITNFVDDLQHQVDTRQISSTSRRRIFENLQRRYGSSRRPLTARKAQQILKSLDAALLSGTHWPPAETVLTRGEVVRLRWTLLHQRRPTPALPLERARMTAPEWKSGNYTGILLP